MMPDPKTAPSGETGQVFPAATAALTGDGLVSQVAAHPATSTVRLRDALFRATRWAGISAPRFATNDQRYQEFADPMRTKIDRNRQEGAAAIEWLDVRIDFGSIGPFDAAQFPGPRPGRRGGPQRWRTGSTARSVGSSDI
jgi:hypothetical protein